MGGGEPNMKQFPLQSALHAFAVVAVVAGPLSAIETKSSLLGPELTANRPAAPAPVRLPSVEVLMFESSIASTPFLFTPIASLKLDEFQTAPAVKLGIGQPSGEKPSIGGWISFGGGTAIAQ